MTLLLFGQPELKRLVEQFKPFSQRVGIKCHLDKLDWEDAHHYIQSRLRAAGREDPIFVSDALQLIYDHTGGIPRKINTLCDLSLLTGFDRKVTQIDRQIIHEIVKDEEGDQET